MKYPVSVRSRVWPCLIAALAVAPAWCGDFVVVCPINGMIDDGVCVLVDRAVREAHGAKALVFEVDTPGGLVDAALRISQRILDAPCMTIAYVKGMGAISAGAVISYSCKKIVMAPDTNMGAAQPVLATSEGMEPTGEKEVSFLRARMRTLAERNNYNPAIAEAMVDKDIELRAYTDPEGKLRVVGRYAPKLAAETNDSAVDLARKAIENLPPEMAPVKEMAEKTLAKPAVNPAQTPSNTPPIPENAEIVLPSGKLLTLTPNEALRYGVIETISEKVEDALAFYNVRNAEIRLIDPTWAESLFRWLTSPMIAGLLLMLGIGGIYVEMKTPGVSLPGIVGIICLALFFGSHYLIGVAEWLDLILVIAGLALIIAEVFVFPGHGILAAAGMISLLAGLYLTLTGVTIPQYSWEYERIEGAATSLAVAGSTLVLLIYATWKLFPHTPLYGAFVLQYAQHTANGYTVQTAGQQDSAIGLKGVASSMLRPAGRGRFGDTTYSIVTRGDFIENGTPIVIVQVDGNRFVVEKWKEKS
jgi:membrane-bound serine protease (ClpP class)